MSQATRLRGVVHGQTIALNQPVDFSDGEMVEVTIAPLPSPELQQLAPGEGLRRSAGAWADDAAALDEYLAWNRQQRKQSRSGTSP
jgi:hypothetical protein